MFFPGPHHHLIGGGSQIQIRGPAPDQSCEEAPAADLPEVISAADVVESESMRDASFFP